jgi:hypothetical protein
MIFVISLALVWVASQPNSHERIEQVDSLMIPQLRVLTRIATRMWRFTIHSSLVPCVDSSMAKNPKFERFVGWRMI